MKKKRNHKITLIEILALILITSIILIIAIPEIISATHKRITSATFETTLEKHGFTVTTENTGVGQPHNNMPPYLAVNVWKRTA